MINLVLILIASFLWSTSFPVIKYALRFSHPFDLLFIRFAFASFFSTLILLVTDRSFSPLKNKTIAFLGMVNVLGFISQFYGQRLTTSSNASVLSNTSVIFTAILSLLILKEKFNIRKVMAGIFAIMGVFIISTGFRWEIGSTLKGDMLVLLSAVCWAIFTILNKSILSKERAQNIVLGIMIWTFIFIIPYSLFIKNTISLKTVLLGLYLSLFCSIIPLYLFNLALKKIGAFSTVLYLSTEVIFAVFLSFIFLDEKLTFYFLLGTLLVLSGISLNPQN